LASVIDSSLDQNWGNTATKIVKLKIPKGIKLYEGVAAPQKGLVGSCFAIIMQSCYCIANCMLIIRSVFNIVKA
jgi:hypothetical protein